MIQDKHFNMNTKQMRWKQLRNIFLSSFISFYNKQTKVQLQKLLNIYLKLSLSKVVKGKSKLDVYKRS